MQMRYGNGRYAGKFKLGSLLIIFIGIIAWSWIADEFWFKEPVINYTAEIIEAVSQPDRLDIKIAELKEELLNELAKCETGGIKDPDGAIIFDSNNQPSIGHLMFQRETVKHYVKLFQDREISNAQAIALAINHDEIRGLAERIIFEDEKGWKNWFTCGKKLGLEARVNFIKDLMK